MAEQACHASPGEAEAVRDQSRLYTETLSQQASKRTLPPPLDSRAGFSQLAFSGSSFPTGQECPGFQMYANLDSVH